MPAPLPFDKEKVNWTMRADDMELLRHLFPENVNEVVRDHVHHLCEALRRKHFGARAEG